MGSALAVKVSIASGRVRRLAVGDPTIQLLEVLAGDVVDRMATGEQLAVAGETVVDEPTLRALGAAGQSRSVRTDVAGIDRFAVLADDERELLTQPQPAQLRLPAVDAAGWIHPAVAPLLRAGQARFLAELRPAAALFVRFGGIDYEADGDAQALLDGYIHWVQKVIQRYEGLLVQLTTGDKGSYLYAAFGAPIAHDDDAKRATAAALDLLQPPQSLAHIGPIQAGISSGVMRVGAYGSDSRCTYGVLGDAVNVAARLMMAAEPGQIIVTRAVADALGGAMTLAPLGARTLKGKGGTIDLFSVHGRADQPAALQMQLYAEPLVGRATEIAPLVEAVERLARHEAAGSDRISGRIMVIEGPAGIGKSHMAAALVLQARKLGIRPIHAGCQSTARAIPFFAARQLVRTLLDIPANAAGSTVVQAVATLAPHAAARAPLLADLLGIQIDETPLTAGLDARIRQGARTTLFVELVAAAAQRQPLLLTIEDAHWIDEGSRDLCAMLLHALPARAAMLCVQRPSDSNGATLLGGALPPHSTFVQLGELTRDATAALIAQRLGSATGAVDALACDVIHAQSQGNPFFVEELVSALREAGRLVAAPSGWALSEATVASLRAIHALVGDADAPRLTPAAPLALVDLGVPDSVQGVVLARLDKLPETARMVLKVASVVGRSFALDLLHSVRPLQGSAAEVRAAVEHALARDFVRAEAAGAQAQPDEAPRYLFKHNIIRDVAYNTLLDEQQRELHESVGDAIETLRPDDIEELAHHFFHSDTRRPDVRTRALAYLGRAGRRAQHDYANDTALLYYGRAAGLEPRAEFLVGQVETLHILGRREDERAQLAVLDAAADASPAQRTRLWGDYYESVADYAQAEAVLKAGLAACAFDALGEAECRNRLGMIAWRQADYDAAEAHFSAARALCREAEPAAEPDDNRARAESANTDYGMGLVYRQQGRYEEARSAFESDLEWQRAHGSREREARARTALGHVESIVGNHRDALVAYEAALAIRKAIGDRAGIGASLLAVAQAWGSLGDHAQARPYLEQALQIQQAIHNRFEEWLVWNELGILHWLVGQYDDAMRALEAGLAISRAIESDFGTAYLLSNLGMVQRDAGDPVSGAASLRVALAMAIAQGDASLEATCHGDLALALLDLDEPTAALTEANEAAAQLEALGQHDSLTAVYAAQASAEYALGNSSGAMDAARRGLGNLAAHGGDYFPHRDGYWCARVLAACGAHAEAQSALRVAADTLRARAERISDPEMRSNFLQNIGVNRAILAAVDGEATPQPLPAHTQ